MDATLFNLLQETTDILVDAAEYYVVSNSKTAAKARVAISTTSIGHDSFHSSIYGRLVDLQAAIRESKIDPAAVDRASSAIQQTLSTFEALAAAKSDGSLQLKSLTNSYPALGQLRALYDGDGSSKRRPKPLGYRKYLFCPSMEMRAKLKTDINACHHALSRQINDLGISAILSDLETIHEWKVPSSLSKVHANRVRDVLSRHWSCSCACRHKDAKLAFTALPKAPPDNTVLAGYQLMWPADTETGSVAYSPALHLLERSEENSAGLCNTVERRDGKTVRFAFDGTSTVSKDCEYHGSVCAAVRTTKGNCVLKLDESAVSTVAMKESRRDGKILSPMLSLRSSMATTAKWPFGNVKSKDRITIAVALAYIYLYLSDTEWWSKQEVVPDFYFMHNTIANTIQTTLPFLSFRTDDGRGAKSSTEGYINPQRPSLPAFGKLLLELWKGTALSWGEQLDAAVAECEDDALGEYWLCAVNACLGKENALKEEGSFRDSARMRSVFVLKVVKSLQWLFEKCVRLPMDSMFPAPEQTPLVISSHRAPRKEGLSLNLFLDVPENVNKWCLHDGTRTWDRCEENGKEAAEIWLRQLRDKVHPFLNFHAHPIKVAIVDTGVQFDKKTRIMYGPRLKEVRSWTDPQSGKEGVLCPDGEDMDGHGTHATSVFLEVDPFSEVFVAKVFESRDEKQGASMQTELQHRVANAITYAVNVWKVQVITMSFGFDRQVGIIGDAIKTAEDSNILFFAAASNNGGNARLSWPARHSNVFSIYASDGYGNKYWRNPTQQRHDDNFAVLGSHVNAWWPSGQKILRSGTSTAAPIAAGLASMILHFIRQHQQESVQSLRNAGENAEEVLERLTTFSGMRSVFRLMVERDAENRDGYSYIAPWWLLDRSVSHTTVLDKIMGELRQV